MAWRTRAAVPGLTFSESLMVRETVAVETFARFATSLMFMHGHEGRLGRRVHFSNDWVCVGRTLLPDAFDFDFSWPAVRITKSESKASDKECPTPTSICV